MRARQRRRMLARSRAKPWCSPRSSPPERAEEIGLPRECIILSAKVSAVQDLIAVYCDLARRSNYALHLGLTEAGMGSKGIVASSAALSVLLQQGIGDTIRISLTPEPGGDRTLGGQGGAGAPADHGVSGVCPPGRGLSGLRAHDLHDVSGACPRHPGLHSRIDAGMEAALSLASRSLNVAVMGCIVNGPGESKHADIGISLPGTGEQPAAPVFVDGKEGRYAARGGRCRRIQADGDRLHRAPLWAIQRQAAPLRNRPNQTATVQVTAAMLRQHCPKHIAPENRRRACANSASALMVATMRQRSTIFSTLLLPTVRYAFL